MPRTPAARIVAIREIGAGLGRSLDRRVCLEQLVVGSIDAVWREDPPQGGEDAGLPIDERAVAIEGEGVECTVVKRHPDIIADLRAAAVRRKPARPDRRIDRGTDGSAIANALGGAPA